MEGLNFLRKNKETIYPQDESKERPETLVLNKDQKDAVRGITMGIEEVDETIRAMAVEDVIHTLENGHPLNRLITDQEDGKTIGYIACEDFIPHEAYIKYLGSTKNTGRDMLKEITVFLAYAKQQGYEKINFHGWNERLNHVLERYGFDRIRTDKMGGYGVNFYEKVLAERKSSEDIEKDRVAAFEQKYINKINQEYTQTLATFSQENRDKKERSIGEALRDISGRLVKTEDLAFGDRQKSVLKLKLARYFQQSDTCDLNVLYDAIIESPKFINTDKGSLNRLLEVHEEKTMQKIAEMRKQRAEVGGNEAFNPYENLLTTKSGNYHIARLLNMPHLEEESEYMKHCVGTSDSYINKMKRGEVEILSFRNAPKVNPATGRLEGDTPLMTIEYNLKTKVIEQMKKYDDNHLSKSDAYFDDVIDGLKQLRTTTTDTGELRTFAKIAKSELESIPVADYNILTEYGEVSFRDFNPEDGIFVLKLGAMEITPDTPKEDAVKILKIVEDIDCKPEQVARSREEITDETKVYIGPLFLGIFQKDIEHVYTAFPEGRVLEKKISIGGKGKEKLIRELNEKGKAGSHVEQLLKSDQWQPSESKEDIDLVRVTVKDLGFAQGATTSEIFDKANEIGLGLCPAEVGPQLRLQYDDQLSGTQMRVGMKPIKDSDGRLSVFHVYYDGDVLCLSTFSGAPGGRWGADNGWVFARRKYTL